MANLCEVCASEPSKYRCPTCGLASCSLVCTQSHKIYCAPKVQPTIAPGDVIEAHPLGVITNENGTGGETQATNNGFNLPALASSPQVKGLLYRYPSLREHLRDIYQVTLQEEWVEGPPPGDRPRHFGRGKMAPRSRGPWTREKGFNRGLGKVRRYRERCEDEAETRKTAEGFMQLLALIRGDHSPQ